MISIRVSIPERLIEKIDESDLSESEVVIAALDSYFNGTKAATDLHWRKFIEAKLEDIQNQIDQHRIHSKDDNMVEFDSDLRRRVRGEKPALDIASSESIRVSNPPAVKYPKQNRCTVEEVSLDDVDLKL